MTSKTAITQNRPYVSSQYYGVNLEPGFLFSYLKIYPAPPPLRIHFKVFLSNDNFLGLSPNCFQGGIFLIDLSRIRYQNVQIPEAF